jgi:hypothetical protein
LGISLVESDYSPTSRLQDNKQSFVVMLNPNVLTMEQVLLSKLKINISLEDYVVAWGKDYMIYAPSPHPSIYTNCPNPNYIAMEITQVC